MLARREKKPSLHIESLDERIVPAVAIGTGGLAGVAVAIDHINVPIDIDVVNNTICVNVAAINSRAGC